MAMKENTRKVFDYVKEHGAENITAADVAAALNLGQKTVDGCFTSGIQRKGLGIRVPAEIELDDGSHKGVKLLKLTDEGLAFDPDSEEIAD